ncbi:MAG: hypothetical protein JXR07_06405 [Reichenbachiella sp.]
MISLFRKVKRQMLSENRFTKYLMYAIGEIILVVVGILIAVQINTFIKEENRKVTEREVLEEILKNLNRDKIEIQDELNGYQIIMDTDEVLINHYRNRLPFVDSIGSKLYVLQLSPHFNPTTSGYNLLESKGIDLITNDSLRIQITDFYERAIPYYQKYEAERIQYIQSFVQPYFLNNFTLERYSVWPYYKRIPMDIESLKDDSTLISYFQNTAYLAENLTKKARQVDQKIDALRNLLKANLSPDSPG